MNCIKILTDEDFGLNRVDFNNPRIRYGARGIIVRNDGKIAIFNKSNKTCLSCSDHSAGPRL